MEHLPPLPTIIDNKMEISRKIEFELEYEGKTMMLMFLISMEVIFDEASNEILVECTEERINDAY
ncbi:hypothetical protein ISS09_05065 [Candidatus Woesearchaeota archaeon]|nr:hypothetical protein [Candidatus Woesearchaeota archaeon]